MATRVIEAKAVISAQDRTGGVLAAIGARLRALGRVASGTSARVAVANAAQARGTGTAVVGALSARSRARADAVAARGGLGVDPVGMHGGKALAALGGAAAVGKALTTYADDERKLTRIGVTADASKEAMESMRKDAYKLAMDTAQPFGKVVEGMETLAAQGRTLKEVRDLLPSVAKTAQASGAEVADIAKSADAVASHLKVPASQMQLAFDTMADAGKRGTFELKDMARYLPSMLPAAKALGIEGTKGLSDISAMLQVVRKGTGSSEEAASSMQNIFAKMESQETTKRFSKMGIDLEGAMKKARAEGRNLLEVFEDLSFKALKGDLSKLPQLFSDMEFARGMRALLSARGEWQKMSAAIQQSAPGTTDRDLGRVLDNVQARLDRMATSARRTASEVGGLLSMAANPLMDKIGDLAEGARKAMERTGADPKGAGAEALDKLNRIFGDRDPIHLRRSRLFFGSGSDDDRRREAADNVLEDAEKRRAGIGREIDKVRSGSREDRGLGTESGRAAKRAGRIGQLEDQRREINDAAAAVRAAQRALGDFQTDANRRIEAAKSLREPGALTGTIGPATSQRFGLGIGGQPSRGDIPEPPVRPGQRELTPGPQVSSMEAIRSALSGANVEAKLSGSATVEGSAKVEVLVKVDGSGITQTIANAVANLKGQLTATGGNGPGSTGRSSPDAAAGGLGAAP